MSEIQYYIEYIIKNMKYYQTISKINNTLVFKITDRYKFVLQTTETMKLFGSTKSNTQNKEWIKYTKS